MRVVQHNLVLRDQLGQLGDESSRFRRTATVLDHQTEGSTALVGMVGGVLERGVRFLVVGRGGGGVLRLLLALRYCLSQEDVVAVGQHLIASLSGTIQFGHLGTLDGIAVQVHPTEQLSPAEQCLDEWLGLALVAHILFRYHGRFECLCLQGKGGVSTGTRTYFLHFVHLPTRTSVSLGHCPCTGPPVASTCSLGHRSSS